MPAVRKTSWLVLGFVTAVSCSPQPAPPTLPDRGVRIAVHSDALSLDPHFQNEALTFAMLSNVVEYLVEFDDRMRIRGMLAESWDSPDDSTWRFHLRQGVVFHDGTPCEAEDVVASFEVMGCPVRE